MVNDITGMIYKLSTEDNVTIIQFIIEAISDSTKQLTLMVAYKLSS